MSDQDGATARPWRWQNFGRGLVLVSASSGVPIVMDFVRAGMQAAEPRFGKRTDSMGGVMVPLSQWPDLPPDAELIVRAVNAHDDLLAAAKVMLRALKGEQWDARILAAIIQLESAINQVEAT